MRNNKGITLIALVITIIVLLILAGVSIAMLTGENGILTQSQNAKSETAIAEAADKINMALNGEYANILADGKLTGKNNTEVESNNGLTGEGFTVEVSASVVDATDGTIKADQDGEVISISKTVEGTLVEGTITKTGEKYTIDKADYPGE